MSGETALARLKRLKMRSWRRGTKEMDLILGPFADMQLAGMDANELAQYEALLDENDQDLYQWISGQQATPEPHKAMVAQIMTSITAKID
ncbi:MAG: succinate dehydrogenase assembly factor 2 [Paracoccaceae bacterium]